MKKIITACFLLLLINSFAIAQKGETAIEAAVESLRKAMIDADKTNLDKLTAPELSYGHSNGRVETKTEFVESLVTAKSDFASITLSDQAITLSGDAAIVRHILSGETMDNGTKGTVKLSVLTVWQKQKGQWKLLARQAVRLTQ